MLEYRLTVVKLSDGGYQVSYYHKSSPWNVSDMDKVVVNIAKLYQCIPSALRPEPTLVGLDEDDSKRVMNFRERLLKEGLDSKIQSSTLGSGT